ncbi:MAG: NADH-quinone oxidoreductase subunit L [Planctomycetota bacterium]|nr:NADH-quinone oxidoreductase subunit L [Planctomycetota bacterium]
MSFIEEFFAWAALLAPLGAAVLMTLSPSFRRSGGGPRLAILSVLFGLGVGLAFWIFGTDGESVWHWMDFRNADGEGLVVDLGVIVDPLSKLMLLVVCGVGSAIFVYALGYMKGDPSIGRFYAKFALFVFSMLGIVFANNFLMIFIFWELVGASSYLLIVYYWQKPSAVEAGKKAFLTNRVADFGFLLGILMIWQLTGSFSFTGIQTAIEQGELDGQSTGTLALAAFLIFLGAAGKSAQIPFHVWLPDAMEGPTPVSALMHAATMVAAGVYMVVRVFFCFGGVGGVDWGWAPEVMANTGALTAVLAATIALVQRDIKKVLAYSTLSQLGYMTMALGAGAYSIAMFHLTTHAFFKGLLFLCAGSVIHGCHHEQDMFAMGGLRKKMPVTFWTFTIGMLALTGAPFLAGWWSKDLILDALHVRHFAGLQLVATLTAGLTALYMARAWFLTFFGTYRGTAQVHESPRVMTVPLVLLAGFSCVVGFPATAVQNYLAERSAQVGILHINASIAIVSTAIVVVGYFVAWLFYFRRPALREKLGARLKPVHELLWNKYYIDEFYLWIVRSIQQAIARACRMFEENVIVRGIVGGTVSITRGSGDRLRRLQTGRLAFYAYVFVAGVTLVVIAMVIV